MFFVALGNDRFINKSVGTDYLITHYGDILILVFGQQLILMRR